jgi:hypothetical protein
VAVKAGRLLEVGPGREELEVAAAGIDQVTVELLHL